MSKKLTSEERAKRDEYRIAYKRAAAKRQYQKLKAEGAVVRAKTPPRFKEDRGEVRYCDCGCGRQLDDSRYTEHYATRKCFIGTFHQIYCNQSIEIPIYEG